VAVPVGWWWGGGGGGGCRAAVPPGAGALSRPSPPPPHLPTPPPQLRDRRQFYSILQRHGIPTPAHVVLDRSRAGSPPVVTETEDAVEVDGVRINKPFVEKVSRRKGGGDV
jgi:hypothetical protein